MPECMDGVTFDALYCDASLSEVRVWQLLGSF
jgi:hypothetical protein